MPMSSKFLPMSIGEKLWRLVSI